MKTLYTAHVTSTHGRDGTVKSDDNVLSLKLSRPGAGGGTNPEQLFAAGYSACFLSALTAIAGKEKVAVEGASLTAEVSLNQDDSNGFFLKAALDVQLPQTEQAAAEKLIHAAHEMCPYSKATRGNVEVTLKLNGQALGLRKAA